MLTMAVLPQRDWRMRLKGVVAAALFSVLSCLGLFAFTMPSHATEEPDFKIIREIDKDIELRDYAAYLVAEVEVPGPASEAGSQAFPILAGYIFGKNKGERKLAVNYPALKASHYTQVPTTKLAPGQVSDQGECNGIG